MLKDKKALCSSVFSVVSSFVKFSALLWYSCSCHDIAVLMFINRITR